MTSPSSEVTFAAALLKQGKLVAIPTETVYGLGADARCVSAVQDVYRVKGRPLTNPLIVHISDRNQMEAWAINIPEHAWRLAEAFWPGPLTLILKRHPTVPMVVTAGQETVALRVPQHPLTLALLRTVQSGIAAPSANRYGQLSPTTAEHVRKALQGNVDYILDGGPCERGIESTIVDVSGPSPMISRYGALGCEALSKVLGQAVVYRGGTFEQHGSPGSAHAHYAPSRPLHVLAREVLLDRVRTLSSAVPSQSFGVLSFVEKPRMAHLDSVAWIQAVLEAKAYMRHLYQWLHQLDHERHACLLVETPPEGEAWLAIHDRLWRAAFVERLGQLQ